MQSAWADRLSLQVHLLNSCTAEWVMLAAVLLCNAQLRRGRVNGLFEVMSDADVCRWGL